MKEGKKRMLCSTEQWYGPLYYNIVEYSAVTVDIIGAGEIIIIIVHFYVTNVLAQQNLGQFQRAQNM